MCVYTVRLTFLKIFFVQMKMFLFFPSTPLWILDMEEVQFGDSVCHQKLF
jgi:hypothetical protein